MPTLLPSSTNNGGFMNIFDNITDALNKGIDTYSRFREANGDFDTSNINDRTPSNEPFNEIPESEKNNKMILYAGLGLGAVALLGVVLLSRK